MFRALNNEANIRGIYFEVHFFSDFDKSRPAWRFMSKDLDYKHRFWKPNFKRGPVLHFNYLLLNHIRKEKPDLIISGGVWSSINAILLIIFSKIPIIGWDETNRFDFGSVKKSFIFIKRTLVNRLNFFAVPGKESILFYKELMPDKKFEKKIFLKLPNLVDERLFTQINKLTNNEKAKVAEKYNLPIDKKIIYWPARFIKDKGIEKFIQNLELKHLKNWIIIILGNGPLQKNIEGLIISKGFEEHIFLLNTLPYEEAIKFYQLADMLIMPSLSDSNPLSLVEAIHSSLPLLISNRVGNMHEVLIEGENGVSIDPYDLKSTVAGIEIMFNKTLEELKSMGEKSKEIANKNFDTNNTVSQFFDDLTQKYNII